MGFTVESVVRAQWETVRIFAARQEVRPKSVAVGAISSVSGVTVSGGVWLGLVGHWAALGEFPGPKFWEGLTFVVFLF